MTIVTAIAFSYTVLTLCFNCLVCISIFWIHTGTLRARSICEWLHLAKSGARYNFSQSFTVSVTSLAINERPRFPQKSNLVLFFELRTYWTYLIGVSKPYGQKKDGTLPCGDIWGEAYLINQLIIVILSTILWVNRIHFNFACVRISHKNGIKCFNHLWNIM